MNEESIEEAGGSSCGSDCEDLNLLTMEPIGEAPQKLVGFRPLLILTEIIGAILLVFVLFWIIEYKNGFGWSVEDLPLRFNWHPFLMVLGMVVLYSQSILIYRIFRDTRKRKLKIIHASIHALIFVFIVIGAKAVFDFHNLSNPPIPNLYSIHSWVGLSAIIMFTGQYVAGFISFLFPGLKINHKAIYLPVHVFFGIGGFILSVTACLMGLNEKAIFSLGPSYQLLSIEGFLINVIGVILLVFASFVVYLVTKIDYRRLPKEEDGMLLSGLAD